MLALQWYREALRLLRLAWSCLHGMRGDGEGKVGLKVGPYETGRVYQGDCLELMKRIPDNQVDIVMTSPPYNTLPQSAKASGLHAVRRSGRNLWLEKAAKGYFDARPEGEYQRWMLDVFTQARRLAIGLVWVNHKVRYRDGEAVHPVRFLPFPIWSEIIWDRGGSMALNCKRFCPSHECLIGFGLPHFWDDSMNTYMSVWRINPDRGDDSHPCAYPFEIPRRTILASCPPGGIVLDPFSGAGTTGVACVNLGREFLGFEIDPHWCEVANERIEAARRGVTVGELKAGQMTLFDMEG